MLCLPGEIQQVLTNLIGNALDALHEKGRLICGSAAGDGSRRPRGRGASPSPTAAQAWTARRFDRLFHPFVTTKGEAGTGLGLWVSKGILDKHHGKIAVRSKPGCGTVFRLFFLPEAQGESVGIAQ